MVRVAAFLTHSVEGTLTIPTSYIRVRAVVWECDEGQSGRHTDSQTTVTNIHFTSAVPQAKLMVCFEFVHSHILYGIIIITIYLLQSTHEKNSNEAVSRTERHSVLLTAK